MVVEVMKLVCDLDDQDLIRNKVAKGKDFGFCLLFMSLVWLKTHSQLNEKIKQIFWNQECAI